MRSEEGGNGTAGLARPAIGLMLGHISLAREWPMMGKEEAETSAQSLKTTESDSQ